MGKKKEEKRKKGRFNFGNASFNTAEDSTQAAS
jgi:hypothetical protein